MSVGGKLKDYDVVGQLISAKRPPMEKERVVTAFHLNKKYDKGREITIKEIEAKLENIGKWEKIHNLIEMTKGNSPIEVKEYAIKVDTNESNHERVLVGFIPKDGVLTEDVLKDVMRQIENIDIYETFIENGKMLIEELKINGATE